MCKSAIINNQYVEMVADNYQGYRRGPHTHATGSLSFCINLTYRTAEVSTYTPVYFSLVCSETQDMVLIQKLFIQGKKM